MIQLLFSILFAEIFLLVFILFRNKCRKFATMFVDRLKRGRGPTIVRTVSGTIFVVFATSLYSVFRIGFFSEREFGSLSPTDQVLISLHLLECTLMGFILVLVVVIDRLHEYILMIRGLRNNMEAVMKQNRSLEESRSGNVAAKDEQIAKLEEQLKLLKSETEAKTKEAKANEASVVALKKQHDGFSLEYDRLTEENKSLREQLKSLDQALSRSDGKKSS